MLCYWFFTCAVSYKYCALLVVQPIHTYILHHLLPLFLSWSYSDTNHSRQFVIFILYLLAEFHQQFVSIIFILFVFVGCWIISVACLTVFIVGLVTPPTSSHTAHVHAAQILVGIPVVLILLIISWEVTILLHVEFGVSHAVLHVWENILLVHNNLLLLHVWWCDYHAVLSILLVWRVEWHQILLVLHYLTILHNLFLLYAY